MMKCDLCGRRTEAMRTVFDGNVFDACELCREYLQSKFDEDEENDDEE